MSVGIPYRRSTSLACDPRVKWLGGSFKKLRFNMDSRWRIAVLDSFHHGPITGGTGLFAIVAGHQRHAGMVGFTTPQQHDLGIIRYGFYGK